MLISDPKANYRLHIEITPAFQTLSLGNEDTKDGITSYIPLERNVFGTSDHPCKRVTSQTLHHKLSDMI